MGLRIFVAEDDEAVFELIKLALEDAGHSVTKVSVAAVAESVVGIQPYDYFIVDLGLVGGDGMDVLKTINRQYPNQKEKIIVHTGTKPEEPRKSWLKDLCGTVITKGPDSVELLLKTLV